MNTCSSERASAQSVEGGPVSDSAPGPFALGKPDPFWHGERGQAVQGGYVDPGRMAHAVCFRWHEVAKPGRWIVSIWSGLFCAHFDAVIDDFGNMVRVGVPS